MHVHKHIRSYRCFFLVTLTICKVNRKSPFQTLVLKYTYHILSLQFRLLFQWSLPLHFYFIPLSSFSRQKNIRWKMCDRIKDTCVANSPPRKETSLLYYGWCYYSCIFMSMVIYEYFCGIFRKMNSNSIHIFFKSEFK